MTRKIALFFAILLILMLSACDAIDSQSNLQNDVQDRQHSSISLEPPEFLMQSRAIDTNALAVSVVVSYTKNSTDYELEYEVLKTESSQADRWNIDIGVPANTPFTLIIKWFEKDPDLDLLRITRNFEAISSTSSAKFTYAFSSESEFYNADNSLDYAGFNTDGDSKSNLAERIAGTDPFTSDIDVIADPITIADPTLLVVTPGTLFVASNLQETSSTSFEITNNSDTQSHFNAVSNASWLTINPISGDVLAFSSLTAEVTIDCGTQPEQLLGEIDIRYEGEPITIPVTANCLQAPEPVLSTLTTSLNLSAQVNSTPTSPVVVLFKNSGNALLTYSIISDSSWLTPKTLSGQLQNGETASIELTAICNSEVGTRTGSIEIQTNAGSEELPIVLSCVAEPIAILLVNVTNISLEAQNGKTVKTTIELKNDGNRNLEYSLNIDNSWIVSVVKSGSIEPQDTHNLNLTAQCGNDSESQTGSLQISSNGGDKLIPVELTCTQQPTPILSNISTPSNLATGIGTSVNGSITINNSGNAPLEYTLSEALDWLDISEASGVVQSGSAVSIGFTANCPTTVSKLDGSVSISSNGGDSSASLSLDCRGPILSNVTPQLFDFSAEVGQTDRQNLSLSNTGNETLSYTISSVSEWLCIDNQASAGCLTASLQYSDTLLAGETESLPISARCQSETVSQTGNILIQTNAGTDEVPITLTCVTKPVCYSIGKCNQYSFGSTKQEQCYDNHRTI